jgi:hypothetical protein
MKKIHQWFVYLQEAAMWKQVNSPTHCLFTKNSPDILSNLRNNSMDTRVRLLAIFVPLFQHLWKQAFIAKEADNPFIILIAEGETSSNIYFAVDLYKILIL